MRRVLVFFSVFSFLLVLSGICSAQSVVQRNLQAGQIVNVGPLEFMGSPADVTVAVDISNCSNYTPDDYWKSAVHAPFWNSHITLTVYGTTQEDYHEDSTVDVPVYTEVTDPPSGSETWARFGWMGTSDGFSKHAATFSEDLSQ